jgi:hypothetical protein
MPEREPFVEYEGDFESGIYGVSYKMGIDNSNADLTVLMLAFQLGYDIEKFPENVMLAEVFRRFADEIENKALTRVPPESAELGNWAEQETLPFDEGENIGHLEDEGENNDPKAATGGHDQRNASVPIGLFW